MAIPNKRTEITDKDLLMKTLKRSPLYGVGVNCNIAAKIVELQQNGFKFDFEILAGYQVFCVQENAFISLKDLSNRVIDECFNQLTHCDKYSPVRKAGYGERTGLPANQIPDKFFV